ncbi:MAG TPA: glycoside hydrolase family 2 TIM barrel-domain containing protein, partial [Solirubrobacteraceae bacterium]|nr:glycoside hydrolase family 2 TIM barrel-domain containing protein [Solirubrobacteraceae bacterium]
MPFVPRARALVLVSVITTFAIALGAGSAIPVPAAGAAESGGSTAPSTGASGTSETTGAPSGSATASIAPAGPSGRYNLDGTWLFRLDHGKGLKNRYESSTSTAGWARVSVPNAWNAKDQSKASMKGTVAWYRKDFELPAAGAESTWLVRFESVNNRVQAWLNGKPIGSHSGAYSPFVLTLPARLLKSGANHLTLRVDSRRKAGDFPSVGLWWNYSGILRRVYLEHVDRVGFGNVQVLPKLPCPTCAATVEYRVGLHNYSSVEQTVSLSSTFGTQPVSLGTGTIAPGATRTFTGQTTIAKPELWSTESPHLYAVTLSASLNTEGDAEAEQKAVAALQPVARYSLRTGVRSIEVTPEGLLMLNGRRVDFRGVGLVEDSKTRGAALSEAQETAAVEAVREVGATAIRSQYPLDQHIEELADQDGILLWSEIPVDQVSVKAMQSSALRARAVTLLKQNILANSNHPSIVVWSIADELAAEPDAAQGEYIATAAAASHTLDPTRPVGLAV